MTYGTLAIDTIQSSTTGTPTQFNDGSGTQIGTLCRAWVYFNGGQSPTVSGAIQGSFNVSSITVVGTGTYTINFTNSFVDAKYCVTAGSYAASGNNGTLGPYSYTTTSVSVLETNSANNTAQNSTNLNVAIFR
jgi:hypothetical protein